MTTAVMSKWQGTIKRLKTTEDDLYMSKNNILCRKGRGLVKSNLRVAVHYLAQLDDQGKDYQVPFDREKFEWLLTEPVGKTKLEEAIKIKHTCAKMAGW